MPTFNDPAADAREASEAVRGLAHATQRIENPEVLYPVIGELMATTTEPLAGARPARPRPPAAHRTSDDRFR